MDGLVCQRSDDGSDSACIYLADELDIATAPVLESAVRRATQALLRTARVDEGA
jgi:hypothetical protein